VEKKEKKREEVIAVLVVHSSQSFTIRVVTRAVIDLTKKASFFLNDRAYCFFRGLSSSSGQFQSISLHRTRSSMFDWFFCLISILFRRTNRKSESESHQILLNLDSISLPKRLSNKVTNWLDVLLSFSLSLSLSLSLSACFVRVVRGRVLLVVRLD
jgi:hypothetical protein